MRKTGYHEDDSDSKIKTQLEKFPDLWGLFYFFIYLKLKIYLDR